MAERIENQAIPLPGCVISVFYLSVEWRLVITVSWVQRVVIRIKSDYPMPMLNKCLLFLIKVHENSMKYSNE